MIVLVDLVFTLAAAIFGLTKLSEGDEIGLIFILVAEAGGLWMVGTRLQTRRVRQYDAARPAE